MKWRFVIVGHFNRSSYLLTCTVPVTFLDSIFVVFRSLDTRWGAGISAESPVSPVVTTTN